MVKEKWVLCPICNSKTRLKIRTDTELKNFPLFCPKCKHETLVNIQQMHDDSFALEHQRFLLQLYAKQAGYTIIGAADEYGSGLTLDRPALQKVTEAVVAGKVDVVLVHNLTRIGREWGMTQNYIDLLTRHKVKLLCIRDRLLFDENGATPILTIKNAECPL